MSKKKFKIERNYTSVGEFLREKRIAAGFTQRDVSLALGYSSAQFISNFERGIAVPPLNKLKTIVRMFKIDSSEIVELIIEAERGRIVADLKKAG